MDWYEEQLNPDSCLRLRIAKLLHRGRTGHQELVIFENPEYGVVLGLDGVVQTTERDEFIYHEMIVHAPLLAHGAAREVLIIGGGDGGALEEVLKHRSVRRATLVEIDAQVIELCRRYLPGVSNGAFDDPRAEIVIADGRAFVAETASCYDVIVIDSSDPVGPSAVLFSADMVRDCKRCLTPGGILVTQTGYQLTHFEPLARTRRRMAAHFADVGFYRVAVPSYACGDLMLSWASDDRAKARLGRAALQRRFDRAGLETKFYSPAMHRASFVLPAVVAAATGAPAG